MNNIAFGQYYPTRSLIHSLDARFKVVLAILYIACSFLCRNIISFAALLASAAVLVAVSGIPFKTVLRSLKPIIFILLFTAVINMFFTTGSTILFSWWKITVYYEGVMNALFIAARIIVLIIGTSIFMTYTTSPIELTDALESLMYPFKLVKLPVHEFAMMITIALRFIPTLTEETNKIMAAQKARGADFTSGSIFKRAKALIPVLVPLFVSAFRRADDLATAMECRCYHGGEGRTRLNVPHCRPRDFVMLGIMILFGTALVLINIFGFGYTMA
jgi:energy-coupling factor transport system permease protein